jgi:teichuronic acid biosynthesis glycosyltransferase TuaH
MTHEKTESTKMPDDIPVVVLSTADMDAVVWTNKQHIASRLADYVSVYYIESLGLREPRVTIADIKRIINKGARYFGRRAPGAKVSRYPNLTIITPMVLPWHRVAIVRLINSILIKISVQRKLPKIYNFWTFSPVTYGIEKLASRTVYHSVDLLHELPGVPHETLVVAEKGLIRRSNRVIVSSTGVEAHVRSQGARPLLWENVADVDLFVAARSTDRSKRAFFVGNLTQAKVDFSILRNIVGLGIRLGLAGPSKIDGVRQDPELESLLASPGVEYFGVLSQIEMAVELGKSWVGIIPYHQNQYTSGVFPMKVYEYLSAGIPVVSSRLPSLASLSLDGLTFADRDNFAQVVLSKIEGDYVCPSGDYSSNSWDSRIRQIRELLQATND